MADALTNAKIALATGEVLSLSNAELRAVCQALVDSQAEVKRLREALQAVVDNFPVETVRAALSTRSDHER